VAVKQGTRTPSRAQSSRNASQKASSARVDRLPPHDAALLALRDPSPRVALDGADVLWAAGTAVVAALVYLTTFSGHVALGDAPESVTGVRSLGILHAPGYPSYVLAARLFGDVFAFGSWAARVNAFSLVAAALAVGVVVLIARACGASRAAAAIGALAFATTASFWLNADFAKHYPLTTLLVALPILFVLVWQQRGGWGWLAAAGVSLGLACGSGWQLAAVVAIALAVMLRVEPPRPGRRDLAWSIGGFVVVAAALCLFVVVRAGQHPVVNWGEATSPGRLLRLILRVDFEGVHSGSAGAAAPFFGRLAGRAASLVRDFGWVAAALAVVGIAAWRHMRREVRALLLVAGLLNLLAVAIDPTLGQVNGFLSVIAQGGYMLVAMIAVAVLTALGITAISDYFAVRENVQRQRGGSAIPAWRSGTAVVAAVCAIAVVVPSLVVHYSHANLRAPAFADAYGSRILDELPQHAVLLVWGSEYAMPMIYRQELAHQRRDVTVIAADSIVDSWGREQIAQQLHIGPIKGSSNATRVHNLITAASRARPVYLDVFSMNAMINITGYETQGLVAKVVPGAVGPHKVTNVNALAQSLVASERADHVNHQTWDHTPFQVTFWERARAHIELAKVYALQKNTAGVVRELRRAEAVFPEVPNVPAALDYIVNQHANPYNVVADL
jgi:hypothetical protein